MTSEYTMAGTDGHIRVPGSGASHPRNFGVYPRLLSKYVREEKIMLMEAMIQRMTSRRPLDYTAAQTDDVINTLLV